MKQQHKELMLDFVQIEIYSRKEDANIWYPLSSENVTQRILAEIIELLSLVGERAKSNFHPPVYMLEVK